ncbi:MAG: 50S ribosomal protein L32 [Deltaproteobacteria bacterium]|nr:MAG: 50S ribosomal protein L32 [Deltaproteobacteria bacterium]
MSTFVLQIRDLDESGRDWNFAIGTDWLASALADTELTAGAEDGRLTVHAQRNGMDVLVQGHIEAQVGATCARCLADVSLDVDLALTALFSPEHTRPEGSDEIDVQLDEVNRDYYSGSEVVLDPMVRELLLLEAPMKPLCSEGCEGIAQSIFGLPRRSLGIPRPMRDSPRYSNSKKNLRRTRSDPVAVPKRRTSPMKRDQRRAQHDKVTAPNVVPCPNCGDVMLPHRACPACGYYKGRQVTKGTAEELE